MNARGVWPLIKQSISEWSDDKASQLAAALAYYAAFAIAPLLVIAVAVLGFTISDNEHAKQQVVHYFTQVASGISPKLVRQLVDHASRFGSGLWATIVGVVLTLYGAIYFFSVVQQSLNTIWEVKPRADLPWWRTVLKRLFSMVVVALIALVLLASLGVTTWITSYAKGLIGGGTWGAVATYGTDVLGSLIVYTIVFALVFRLVPDVRIRWSDVWVGAAITAVLFLVGKYGLGFYLSRSSTTSIFGAAGAFAAMLIWVYYSAQIFFFGAEITQVYARRTGTRIMPDDNAMQLRQAEREKLRRKSSPRSEGDQRQQGPALSPPVCEPPTSSKALIAAGGMAAGLLVGAVGWLHGRRDPVRHAKIELAHVRLDKLQSRLDRIDETRLALLKMDFSGRLAEADRRLVDNLRELHRTR